MSILTGFVCTVQTVRAAEASAGVPEPMLMQRAATALAGVCMQLLRTTTRPEVGAKGEYFRTLSVAGGIAPQVLSLPGSGHIWTVNAGPTFGNGVWRPRRRRDRIAGRRAVALVGSGNNGGDALWALAKMAHRGLAVVAIGDRGRMHAAGLAAMRAAGGRVMEWGDPELPSVCATADVALDGIVGIGGSGSLRARVMPAVEALRVAQVPLIAVDVPSGVDADTAEVPGEAVMADLTVTFGVAKPGLLLHPGRNHVGLLTVVDIGLRRCDLLPLARLLEIADLAVPALEPSSYKYSRGVVQVTAGSSDYPGAAHLTVRGARGSGAGMIALRCGPGADPVPVIAAHPDVVVSGQTLFARADARIFGPGLGESRAVLQSLLEHMKDPAPLVVDASGLTALATDSGLAALKARASRGFLTVLTPHEGEFKRLGFDLSGGRLQAARRAAQALRAMVILKGPGTVIAPPEASDAFIDIHGGPELGTAGSGDVLAGMCGGMLAAEVRRSGSGLDWGSAAQACARAVGLHGLAGRLAANDSGSVTALDIAEALPKSTLAAAMANKNARYLGHLDPDGHGAVTGWRGES